MNATRTDSTPREPLGPSLIESVRRFYFELFQTALYTVYRCPVLDPVNAPEDLAQEVVLRLITRSPPHWATQPPALAVQKAWVKRTSRRLCIDLRRQLERRGRPISADWSAIDPPPSRASPSSPPSPLETLVAARQASAVLAALRTAYPRGAELFELVLADPDVTNGELAELLETSCANVHQIRSRARRVLLNAGMGPAGEGAR